MYYYRIEDDTKVRFVADEFVDDPDDFFAKGIKHWTHLTKDGIIDNYGPKENVVLSS